MPKLRISEQEKFDNRFRGIVDGKLKEHCMSKSQLAKRLQFSLRTLYTKLKEPDKFTRWELRKMSEIIKLSDAERAELI